MAKHIIFETLNDVKSLKSTKTSDGLMHLSGTFGVCGVKNNNQRIYIKENYSKMVNQLKEKIANEGCPGELEHPNTMNITLENISHKIDDINIDENGVVSGTITLLNTPKGKIAQSIVEGGLPLFISSRAQGIVDKNTGVVTLENLQTFDLVGTPGFSQARLHLNESELAQAGAITESCYYLTIEHDNDEVNESQKENKSEDNIMEEKIKNLEEKVERLTENIENMEIEHAKRLEEMQESFTSFMSNDFANAVEEWLCKEFEPMVNENLINKLAPSIETWVVEHFSPEIERWVVEQFSPEIEKWVATEYSGELQNWIVEHFSPEIERWITEEYSPTIDGWVNECLRPEIETVIKESVNESRRTSLDTIDKTLEILEEMGNTKPTYSRKQTIVENVNEPRFIQMMPEAKRVEWNLLSEDAKEMVRRRASLRDLTTNESIDKFWADIDLSNQPAVTQVMESTNSFQDTWEAKMRDTIRSWKKH